MFFCTLQNISVFRVGIELGVTNSNIPMADFAITLNRTLTPSVSPLGEWVETDVKDFLKVLMKIFTTHIADVKYRISKTFRLLFEQ